MTFDAHAHVWTTPQEYPWVNYALPDGVDSMVYTIENYVEDMETMGVDQALLVATPIHGNGSPYTIDCLNTHPTDFYGIILVEEGIESPDHPFTDRLEHESILGVRIRGEDLPSTTDLVWSILAERNSQVHLYCLPTHFNRISRLASEYPDIDFVLDHQGMSSDGQSYTPDEPPYAAIRDVADHSNTYVKVTHTPSDCRYPFADIHETIRFLLSEFGCERLFWGSDYIYHFKNATPWQTREWLETLDFLSDGDCASILGRNFKSIL